MTGPEITQDTAVGLLSDLIRLDTSNPPGNEEAAVQFLEAFLKKEGIESDIYLPAPRRANILARIRGKRAGRPAVLLGHLDVVPAHEEGWVAPPFGGLVKDGFVYGRGAIDMKSQIVCNLLSFIELKRMGVIPERDLVFLATADEETSGPFGVEYMLGKVADLRESSFVFSEGGFIMADEAGNRHANVSVGEKQVCWFKMKARGRGGHGSMPHKDSANDKIVRAAHRIISETRPLRATPIVTRYLNGLFKGKKFGNTTFSSLREALKSKAFRAYAESDPVVNSLLTNSVALTMLESGDKVNVIPSEATAYFDARILPDVKHEAFLDRIRKTAGPEVEVALVSRSDSVPSPYNTPYFRNIAKAVRTVSGSVPVLPFMTTGATDLRHFRSLGIPAYGLFPATLPEEEHMRMHAVNERLSVASLGEGLRATREIVRFLASYDPEG
jgi:acetylornithine deacetylase/succinyl-diaminopimelate desuccinylase-like protein